MTARRRSKKPPRKPPGKRGQSAPRSRVPEAEETDETDVFKTPKQLETILSFLEREVTDMAPRMVDAVGAQAPAGDALDIRLRKREPHDIAQAVCQFADSFFTILCVDADSASHEFARKIEQSDALRDLIGYDQLSLEQLGRLFQTLTLEYMLDLPVEVSLSDKVAAPYSTLSIQELERRTETLRTAARDLVDDSHSGIFAEVLRDEKLASQLLEKLFGYSLVLKFNRQRQQELVDGPRRKRGSPQSPYGRFAKDAYQILKPLPDRVRRDLILTLDREFFGGRTNSKKLLDLLTKAGVRQPRPVD